MAHTFSPSTWEAKAGEDHEFEASLVYRASSRTARATQKNPVSKNQNKQTNKQTNKKTKQEEKKKSQEP